MTKIDVSREPHLQIAFQRAALLVLCCVFVHGQEKKQLPKSTESTINSIVSWGEKLNSPGAKAELREIKRGEQNGKLMVAYEVYVTGTPTGESYAMFQWPITEPKPMVALPEVFLGTDGKVCATKDPGCPSPVELAFLPKKGEPFRFMIISNNGKAKVAVMVVPNAIAGADRDCRVEVIRGSVKFEAAIIRGKGFKPNDEVKYRSNSAGEILQGVKKADGNGEFILVFEPFVKGKDKGSDEVAFKAATCAPAVTYKWGTTGD